MLPGVRKSTLKKQLANEVGAVDDSGQKGRPGVGQCRCVGVVFGRAAPHVDLNGFLWFPIDFKEY